MNRFGLLVSGGLSFAVTVAAWSQEAPSVNRESWADDRWSVTDGLELWLDASRALGESTPGESTTQGEPVAKWMDASGHGRHLEASQDGARPVRLPVGQTAIVRFDGTDDALRAVGGNLRRDEVTTFVVAAPRKNAGGFRAVLASNAPDRRDFESGFTLDLGPAPSVRFSAFNVEGHGFGGWRNLLNRELPFRELAFFEMQVERNRVQLTVNGGATQERPREGGPIDLSEWTVGARYYNLGGAKQHVQGFGHWDVAEVLVFGRQLASDEIIKVRAYLDNKYGAVRQVLPPHPHENPETLETVKDPPPLQFLLPGFTVQELPLDLTNINNLLYRPDGSLFALGYNGVIWRLKDTDGDGLEDQAEVFWDSQGALRAPIGMDLTPPGYEHGEGVFVIAKTRCVLIVDTDQDGKADREMVVADGWKESFHQVDGLGVAFDRRDGSVYYGRGTYNFAEPLLKDAEGRPQYRLTDEAGTIIRVSPDFKTREIVATGIRFPVGLRFNRLGDLFATDQEGATWVPNGNPMDELLHIETGRHYGFPPRHPVHLPNVIDEPSVFDYGPQHQSTCGFAFNDPIGEQGKRFGPRNWDGDAFVTGESRGKIYRTKLVKTPDGYIAQSQLVACLSLLTVDCCIAPDGSMRVACHSGGPDWGSGPNGKGKLYRVAYSEPELPQPVLAWSSSPHEVRVEFDRPIDPESLRDAIRGTKLAAGKYARAGDRFETIWPGYAVVQAQKTSPRFDVPVRSMQVTADRRTLVLATDRHVAGVHYALTLPGLGRTLDPPDLPGAVKQFAEVDLDFDLTGCLATFRSADEKTEWSGWLPHPDLEVARAMTQGSATHDALWGALEQRGELTLRMKLDLSRMLRPAIQPGSQIDHEETPEVVTVTFRSPDRLTLKDTRNNNIMQGKEVVFQLQPTEGELSEIEVRMSVESPSPELRMQFATQEDARPRTMPLRRILIPWSERGGEDSFQESLASRIPELEGGSWARGRELFFGDVASCSKCHRMHGRGGDLGPDLSNLIHRDYASVLRDITFPSFAINPDHVSYIIETTDGRVLSGVVHSEKDRLRIGDIKGNVTEVSREAIERISASTLSTMPEGLPKVLGPERLRDLMTFLLTRGPAMPDYGKTPAPLPRSRREVTAILAGSTELASPRRHLHVVLVAGPKDHGPGEHDYPAWKQAWSELFGIAEQVTVETAEGWPAPDQFKTADVMVFYQQGSWTPDRAADMDRFLARGGGAVYIHYAVDGGQDAPGFAQRIGLAWQGGRSKFRHGPLELGFSPQSDHPIARHFERVKFHDESYWQLTGDERRVKVLATGQEDGTPQPLFWTMEPGKGRVFVSIPGHFAWTFDDPLYRVLMLRGIAWAAGEPVDRFNDLVLPGARVRD